MSDANIRHEVLTRTVQHCGLVRDGDVETHRGLTTREQLEERYAAGIEQWAHTWRPTSCPPGQSGVRVGG